MTLKAQNLEIGKDVTNEIARYATAFGAGLLPVHTYYTGSRSWLVPVIKARLTDAAAVAQKCYSALEVQPCGTGLSVYSEPDN